jgi:hypothetical protein
MSARALRSLGASPARERLRVLVKETGSGPLTSAEAGAFDETMVIAQMQGEPAEVFAERAVERIAAAERAGRRFDSSLLLVGDQQEPGSQAARLAIARSMAAHARAHGQSELILETTATPKAALRHELVSLVEELLAGSEGQSVPVRLRFTATPLPNSPPKSGVFWSTPALPS